MPDTSTACHAEGRGFESLQPLSRIRLYRASTVSLSEVADFVTASLRVMPRRALDTGYTFRFPELEPALRDLLGK
jgi:Domain of unknown function (DUF1731)